MVGQESNGEWRKNDYILGTTSANKYIPVYAINTSIFSTNTIMIPVFNDIFIYHKPENVVNTKDISISNYPSLFASLHDKATARVYGFTIHDVNYKINCLKGYIADADDNVLLMLCADKMRHILMIILKLLLTNLHCLFHMSC